MRRYLTTRSKSVLLNAGSSGFCRGKPGRGGNSSTGSHKYYWSIRLKETGPIFAFMTGNGHHPLPQYVENLQKNIDKR
jgi:hypothetical protein